MLQKGTGPATQSFQIIGCPIRACPWRTLFIRKSFVTIGVSVSKEELGKRLSTDYRRQSFEGYPTKVDWSIERYVIKNKKATETHELDRFRPSVWRNTLLLWSIGLYWLSYDIAWVWRGSLPALYSPRSRVTSRLDLRDIQKVIIDYRNLGIIHILTDLIVSLGYLPGVLREVPARPHLMG